MAWNPGPEVAAARDFGKKFDADRVVIIWTNEAGKCGMASYGRTKALCDQTKPVGVMLHRDAMEYFYNQRVGGSDLET
jgi:hypothetical protein